MKSFSFNELFGRKDFLIGLPNGLSFKCISCGTGNAASRSKCISCGRSDPFLFGEIRRLTAGSNSLIVFMFIIGIFILLFSFFSNPSPVFFFSSLTLLFIAEFLKYRNNKSWHATRLEIYDRQRARLENFTHWKTIIDRIEEKEKSQFFSKWLQKRLNEKLPILK